MKKIIFFSFFSIVFIFSSYKFLGNKNLLNYTDEFSSNDCNNLDYKKSKKIHPSNFQSFDIRLQIDEKRKWARLNLRDAINAEKINSFTNRERVNGRIIINIDNELKCSLKVALRAHGDQIDHRQGKGLPSLNVEIKNGHIFGIVDFILLKPKVRVYDNEIFATTLLQQLDLLAPRTASVNLTYGFNSQKFIFQEKIVKEFIENANLREGAIFEGDERFVFQEGNNKNIRFVNHRLANNNWAAKNDNNKKIAEIGLSILNFHGQVHQMDIPKNWVIDYYSLSNKTGYSNYFAKLPTFDAIMFALDAMGNLSVQDRRFYFDTVQDQFLPIFYDGKPTLFSRSNNLAIPQLEKKDNLLLIDKGKIKFYYPNLVKGKVLNSAFEGSENALNLIKKVDFEKLHKKLNKNGMKIDLNKTKQSLEILNKKLNWMSNFDDSRIFKQKYSFENTLEAPKNYYSDLRRRILYYNFNEKNSFKSCDIYGEDCKNLLLNKKNYLKAISQSLKDDQKNEIIFLGKEKNSEITAGWYHQAVLKSKKKTQYINDVKIINNGEIKLKIDNEQRKIFILKENINSNLIFKDGLLSGWEIFFKDISEGPPEFLNDLNGMTGCLNFVDINVKNLKLNLSGSKCEDSINFIRAKGKIDNLKIDKSISDGLDADFSNLKINNAEISNSGNDCADFSFGEYQIINMKLSFCGDKGLSIGERSFVKLKDLQAKETNVGVATKDYGVLLAENLELNNVKDCVAAYNKKQEFSGGMIDIKKINCSNFNRLLNLDITSIIKIKENFSKKDDNDN
ncbi:hypothetical protein N8827_02000 [Pelagibacteraceae bacterium]|nr:hypothetical protein [Pelagibacteraceae bacterium]